MAKAQYIGISGVGRKVKSMPFGVGGVSRNVKSGYVGVGGVARQFLQGGVLASDLSVGSVVKLLENRVAVEYLVVNLGKPSGSSLYDDSCDGIWLLRKNIKENRQWNSSDVNDYSKSTIHRYLNGNFLSLFNANSQSAIKQVKLPYRAGSGYDTTVTSGANGLSAKIFLLSASEVSLNHSSMPTAEGAELSYFAGCADNSSDIKRIANLNGTATDWWLRSPDCYYEDGSSNALEISPEGDWFGMECSTSYGIRPALVLHSNALFDEKTMILKGVS